MEQSKKKTRLKIRDRTSRNEVRLREENEGGGNYFSKLIQELKKASIRRETQKR